MTGSRTPQQIGRSNRRNGKDWQLACAAWLRQEGHYPHASYEVREGASDILGTGDIAVECTLTTWDKIWLKLDQAARDAKRRGLDNYVVWKKRSGSRDPGLGLVCMPAKQFWPLMAELDKRRRQEEDAEYEFERGFRMGRASTVTDPMPQIREGLS